MLLGRAHSNVFDGQRVLAEGGSSSGDDGQGGRGTAGNDGEAGGGEGGGGEGEGGDGDRIVLTGAPARGRVGFLTLFEAYKYVEVSRREAPCAGPLFFLRYTSRILSAVRGF